MSYLSRREFLLSAAAAPLAAQKKTAPPKKPHILLVLVEDIGAFQCGCYGQREIFTPNIDLLARMGMRFLNAFVATPASSPSRATLFTGRTPAQHGIHDFLTPNPVADPPQGQAAPPAWFSEETMIFDLLSQAGYQCGYAGKWHLGEDANPGHGLSFSYTMPAADMPYRNPTMSRNGKMENKNGYLTEVITLGAMEFLDRQQDSAPFFLTVSYPNAAEPYEGHPQEFYDRYAKARFEAIGWLPGAPDALRGKQHMKDPVASLRKFAASVTAVDAQLKPLLDKLREKRLWTNTLIVFTSVTGHSLGRHGLWGGGLASNPVNMFDEVMQVPLIASWPGEIPVQASRPDMVSFYDVLPTLCQAARVTPPQRNLPGRSFYYQLTRQPLPKDEERWPEEVFGMYRNAVMSRDNRFKLILRNEGEGPNELYSLRTDPRERRNEFANQQFVTVRDRHAARIKAWTAKHSR